MDVSDVFGVKKEMVLSYVIREDVDGKFTHELNGDKHIIIYGSSKQGKSALVQKHVGEAITIGCGPKMQTRDIYASLLRQLDVNMETICEKVKGTSGELEVKTGFKAILPFFGQADAGIKAKTSGTSQEKTQYQTIEYNLDFAQDVSELLRRIEFTSFIIIENFHYLEEEIQKLLAFDLRLFQENGIRFIILGIWREKNRLLQFNRDLIDRIVEIPVEPWSPEDFNLVIDKGCHLLTIRFSDEIKDELKEVAFGNIGIVQELCKELCFASGIYCKQENLIVIDNEEYLERAIEKKVDEYASSHLRTIESIADSGQVTNGLYMPYYLIRVIIESDMKDLMDGIGRIDLHNKIKSLHHRGGDVRNSDMSNLLHGLSERQSKKLIKPPLFDYDRVNRRLKIIDSTLMFFLNFKDRTEIIDEIIDPRENNVTQ